MVMLSRTLLGMRWGDLSEDTRQMLLDRADIDGFNGADGDRYSRVKNKLILIFNTKCAIILLLQHRTLKC